MAFDQLSVLLVPVLKYYPFTQHRDLSAQLYKVSGDALFDDVRKQVANDNAVDSSHLVLWTLRENDCDGHRLSRRLHENDNDFQRLGNRVCLHHPVTDILLGSPGCPGLTKTIVVELWDETEMRHLVNIRGNIGFMIRYRLRNVLFTQLARKALSPDIGSSRTMIRERQMDPRMAVFNGQYPAEHPPFADFGNFLAPSIHLYCSVFDKFKARMTDPYGKIPRELLVRVEKLMHLGCDPKISEEELPKATISAVADILGVKFVRRLARGLSRYPGDVAVVVQSPYLLFGEGDMRSSPVIALLMEESQLGPNSGDPIQQAALTFEKILLDSAYDDIRALCCCPVFLLTLSGSWLFVQGAIFTDKLIVQNLCDGIYVRRSRSIYAGYDMSAAGMATGKLLCLREALQNMPLWYEDVVRRSTGSKRAYTAHARFFPEPSSYLGHAFQYEEWLCKNAQCTTFLARLVDTGERIVVKFVQRYGEQAHRTLAEAGNAPKLLYCDTPFAKGVHFPVQMVVMEYVEGDTLFDDRLPTDGQRAALRRAVEILHEKDLVHGDFRHSNIRVCADGAIKVIDFDWTGPVGQVFYPYDMSSQITWHPDVQAETTVNIEKAHDIFMLEHMIGTAANVSGLAMEA